VTAATPPVDEDHCPECGHHVDDHETWQNSLEPGCHKIGCDCDWGSE